MSFGGRQIRVDPKKPCIKRGGGVHGRHWIDQCSDGDDATGRYRYCSDFLVLGLPP